MPLTWGFVAGPDRRSNPRDGHRNGDPVYREGVIQWRTPAAGGTSGAAATAGRHQSAAQRRAQPVCLDRMRLLRRPGPGNRYPAGQHPSPLSPAPTFDVEHRGDVIQPGRLPLPTRPTPQFGEGGNSEGRRVHAATDAEPTSQIRPARCDQPDRSGQIRPVSAGHRATVGSAGAAPDSDEHGGHGRSGNIGQPLFDRRLEEGHLRGPRRVVNLHGQRRTVEPNRLHVIGDGRANGLLPLPEDSTDDRRRRGGERLCPPTVRTQSGEHPIETLRQWQRLVGHAPIIAAEDVIRASPAAH